MIEPKPVQAAEDWGVVLQSVPSKNKKEILKRLAEIFQIDKRDAEQILSNMPLILVDNLSFGLAARVKKFFLTIGAVVETTNHDMIKKNCFQVLWPQTPDLSFFLKHDANSAEVPVQGKKDKAKSGGFGFFEKKEEKKDEKKDEKKSEKKSEKREMNQEASKLHEAPSPVKPTQEPSAVIPPVSPAPVAPIQEFPASVPTSSPAPVTPLSDPFPVSEEKPEAAPSSDTDLDWERRASELNEKLQKFHAEKQELHTQHAEAAEKVKSEYQQQLEEEKRKSDEIARALEELHQREAQKQEELTREGGEWRSRAEALAAKVRELETNLTQKSSEAEEEKQKSSESAKAYEDLQKEVQKHEVLTREGEEWRSKAETLAGKVREIETNLTQKTSEFEQLIQDKDDLSQRSEKASAEAQHELSALRSREQEFSNKIEGLERSVQEMTESLRSRDSVLAQFEKQIMELAEKSKGYESLRREHATIRQEYDAKLDEREMRLAKAEEDHRRYRSRMDRKNAAAARELGEWIRGMDTTRQGLQKLILFLGSESAVLDGEKKSNLRSPLTRGPDAPNPEKS